MDAGSLLPLLGGVILALLGVYMARANKDSVSVRTALDAVAVVDKAMKTQKSRISEQEQDIGRLEGELRTAHRHIRTLEDELVDARQESQRAIRISQECRRRLIHLSEAIRRLGGSVDDSDDVDDEADHG